MKKTILLMATLAFLLPAPLLNFAQEEALKIRPVKPITSSVTLTICSGDAVTLFATPNGAGPFSYSWSPGGQTDSSITVSPAVSSTYIVASSSFDGSSAGIDTIV